MSSKKADEKKEPGNNVSLPTHLLCDTPGGLRLTLSRAPMSCPT